MSTETSLGRALRRIAKGTRLSSLDAPVLDDAADEIDKLTTLRAERDALRAALLDVLSLFEAEDHAAAFCLKPDADVAGVYSAGLAALAQADAVPEPKA